LQSYLGKGTIHDVVWSPDGKTLAVASSLGIYLYDAQTFDELQLIDAAGPVIRVAFSPDGQTIASITSDNAYLWDSHTGQLLHKYRPPGFAWMTSVAFSPDGQTLAVSGESALYSYAVWRWNVDSGDPLPTFEFRTSNSTKYGDTDQPWSIAFSPDGQVLAAGSVYAVRLWSVKTGELLQKIESGGFTFAFSPDGHMIGATVANYSRIVQLLDVQNGKPLRAFEAQEDRVNSIAFSPDSRILASGNDVAIRIWNVDTGALIRALNSSADRIAFSPNGYKLASATETSVSIWDTESGQLLHTLEGYTDSVTRVVFNPNGHVLASGSVDGKVRLWDTNTWKVLRILDGRAEKIVSIAFSPDGHMLTTGSNYSEGAVQLWNIDAGELLRTYKKVHLG
jgi:WD40 repeat protein